MLSKVSRAERLFHEATRHLNEGNLLQAESGYRLALAHNPELAEAHANLAYVLEQSHRLEEAECHYHAALNLNPGHVCILLNYGAMLASEKRFDEAEALYRQALVIDVHSCAVWSNLGVLLACMKREAESEQCYRNALSIDPEYRKAQFNLSYLLLRQGRFEEGWLRFEARDWYEKLATLIPCPRWQGEALSGKSILITIEAGHGDMIQFCRYASFLQEAGASKVSILCHPGLKRLFGTLSAVDDVIALGEPGVSDGWDYWVPLFSLPYWFKTGLTTIPASIPYLHANPERVARWAGQLAGPSHSLRVGLVWKGNPLFENDADRSLPSLSTLSPLWEVPGVTFYSLQKGAGEEEIEDDVETRPVIALGHLLEDFADTAALVINLDLVITVDTSVAHLAGALGKPCWVLLPDYKPDWRWFAMRTDSPWYPKEMRLFRQAEPGDWTSTIRSVQQSLLDLTGSARPALV